MKKMWLYFACLAAIVLISTVFVVFADDSDFKNREFLSGYGWVVSQKSVERTELTLPDTPDAVYENYNLLQKDAALDLTPYYGKKAFRFTYIVLNYPEKLSCEVRANVLCVDGVPVAGDIMTVGAADGFMHSLNFPPTAEARTDCSISRRQ